MKNTLYTALILGLLATQACQNPTSNSGQEKAGFQLQANDSLFHVDQAGYNFNIILPKDLMISSNPEIKVNEATGELNIRLGEHFWIVASQEKVDLSAMKAALSDDMLFKPEIIEENASSILYKRVLPDGTEYDYSFKSCSEISGKPYLFKTSEEGEFSKESVTKMKDAISSIQNITV
jgi:hypothetical protein